MISIKKIFLSYIVLSLFCLTVDAQQEMLFPLHSNGAIKNYLHEQTQATSHNARLIIPSDTLQLPFIDDFSYDGIYPNQRLWTDSNVFINRDFPVNPPTLGVATFDGLDKYGDPYDSTGSIDAVADHLTSNYINLNYPEDTTIWLSFFYQPQGLGEMPDPEDSLMVEFRNPSYSAFGTVNTFDSLVTLTGGNFFIEGATWGNSTIIIHDTSYTIASVIDSAHLILTTSDSVRSNLNYDVTFWDKVWSIPGGPVAPFQQVLINVRDTAAPYLNGHFRFRFTNIANLNGNVDHWHIDFVRLNKDRNANDTAIADEGAFVYRNKSLLAPPFTSMPYSHYKTNPSLFTSTSETVQYKNLTANTLILSHDLMVLKDDGTTDYESGVNAINVDPYTTGQNTKSFNYTFPSLPQSSLNYSVLNINTSPHGILQNDSDKDIQVLDNYYAYDDGTAEAAYGIYGAAPGAELAERYDVKMTDTLRGVEIYWNQFGPNVHNHLLTLAVWDQLTPNTGNDRILYRQFDQKPFNDSMTNGFVTYIFDTAKVVSGTIYIGWIQDDVDLLNIGFDENTDNHDKLYYNVLGTWQSSNIPGSVMMRPIFGSALNVGVHEITKQPDFNASVFPNPASGTIDISVNANNLSSYSFQLFDATGQLIVQQKEKILNISNFEAGFYLLKITDDKTSEFITRKIFVSH